MTIIISFLLNGLSWISHIFLLRRKPLFIVASFGKSLLYSPYLQAVFEHLRYF